MDDFDVNDLIGTNEFIPVASNPEEDLKDFEKYYTKTDHQLEPLKKPEISLESDVQTYETKTLVSIDSRDRIKHIYPKPNHFKIFLGKTFKFIKSIQMASLEFPNTDAVINQSNNRLYWRNLEDIETDNIITTNGVISYPIYYAEFRSGSYTAIALQKEMQESMNLVKKANSTDFHYFVVKMDVDTDKVEFISLNLRQLPNNPLTTTVSSGIVSVYFPNHGFTTNTEVYLLGAKIIAGINSATLTDFHTIVVTSVNTFIFEVNIKASETVVNGGGNVVKIGIKSPFQFLNGQFNNTVTKHIGHPEENSSQLVSTSVSLMEDILQMNIRLQISKDFTQFIGTIAQIGIFIGISFIPSYSFLITGVTDTFTIRVQVPDEQTIIDIQNSNTTFSVNIGSDYYLSTLYQKYSIDSFLVTTNTSHNYTQQNNSEVIYIDESPYIIQSVVSSTQFILPGIIGNPINSGIIPRKNPLSSHIVYIDNIISNFTQVLNVWYSKIITKTDHLLKEGDFVMFNNINPQIKGSYHIDSVINNTEFLIQVELGPIQITEESFISTGLLTMSFPSHGFNSIVNFQNGTAISMLNNLNVPVIVYPIIVTTLLDHNLQEGDSVRFSGTAPIYSGMTLVSGIDPSLDSTECYVYDILANDEFVILKSLDGSSSFTPITISPYITGFLGLDTKFRLYNAADVGNIEGTLLNNIDFTIREILDENTFRFIVNDAYATKLESAGGSEIYISSLIHGFNVLQTNVRNGKVTRSINLQGEDYCFLVSSQLDTMINTGNVKGIFSRISLDQPPGYVCFKYLNNPKLYNVPLDKLEELELSVVYHDGTLYEFNDLDFSFTLEITEVVDYIKTFNVSSKRIF